MNRFATLLVFAIFQVSSLNGEPSVHILAENLDQLITSTTLQWINYNSKDPSLLTNAVIGAYQVTHVSDSEETGALAHLPVYICRARINSAWVSGQMRPQKPVCVVSLYKKISEIASFELLNNIEGSARLSWVHKDLFTIVPQGAVTSGVNIQRTFVARRNASNHNKEGSLTYNIGKFNPAENLGVFTLVDQNNNELDFENGEILVETEPIEYELKNIKMNLYHRRGQTPKPMVLGQLTLRNEVQGTLKVESVIGYNFTYSLYWGKGHGLLTGLPFTAHLNNGTKIKGSWAIPNSEKVQNLHNVEKVLEVGTAVNVTLYGTYVDSDIPYTATVVSIYGDKERREIVIQDSKREKKMINVKAEYGPVYYLHNNTFVPTTTTTTTTTTIRTTSKLTQTTPKIVPLEVPPEQQNKIEEKPDKKQISNSSTQEQEVSENDISLLQKKEAPVTSTATSTFSSLLLIILSCLMATL